MTRLLKMPVAMSATDIVCANILADVLEPLSTCIHEHMKHGAYFITSGIIDTKEKR